MQDTIEQNLLDAFDSGEKIEFRLKYDGPLPADTKHGVCAIKHQIRQALHPQLKDLCENTPALRGLVRNICGFDHWRNLPIGAPREHGNDPPKYAAVGQKFKLGDFQFVPLIIGDLHTICHLDILFLRREKSGALITKPRDEYGGDLDNRLKIFFDALRAPCSLSEIPQNTKPQSSEAPFFCLLEDDSLITKFQVEADTILGPASAEEQTHVSIIARVTTRLTRTMIGNIDFLH